MSIANSKIGQLLVPIENFEKGVAFFNCGGVRLLVGVMPAGQTAQRGSAIYCQVAEPDGNQPALTSEVPRESRQRPCHSTLEL